LFVRLDYLELGRFIKFPTLPWLNLKRFQWKGSSQIRQNRGVLCQSETSDLKKMPIGIYLKRIKNEKSDPFSCLIILGRYWFILMQ
jgi:hypothetical protein